MTINNYIVDQNRFNLAGPPTWWLRKLYEFDNSLVVVPSRQSFLYRLAQRRAPNLQASIVNEALFNQSDTQMLASYNLVPVTTILSTANWSNPFLFEELRRRAPWRLGGAKAMIAQQEAYDREDEFKAQQETDEMLNSLSKDAWGLYRKKIGLQSNMYIPGKKIKPIPAQKAPSLKIGSIFLP